MAAGPKGVAGSRDSLPAQQAAADPLQTYCPDLDQWPRSWAYEERDIPAGLRIVECFKPFLRELLSSQLSRQTLRRHRDNIWALGGEIISRLQMDSDLRRRPIEHGVLDLIGDDGGPLLSQHLGSWRGDHQPIADGQRPPEAANRTRRPRPHRRRRRPAAVAWPVRRRTTFLRRHLPQVLSLSDRH